MNMSIIRSKLSIGWLYLQRLQRLSPHFICAHSGKWLLHTTLMELLPFPLPALHMCKSFLVVSRLCRLQWRVWHSRPTEWNLEGQGLWCPLRWRLSWSHRGWSWQRLVHDTDWLPKATKMQQTESGTFCCVLHSQGTSGVKAQTLHESTTGLQAGLAMIANWAPNTIFRVMSVSVHPAWTKTTWRAFAGIALIQLLNLSELFMCASHDTSPAVVLADMPTHSSISDTTG